MCGEKVMDGINYQAFCAVYVAAILCLAFARAWVEGR
jgi:hypothetical protein